MKEIHLNNGMVALVDDEDFGYLNRWKWTAVKHINTYYATRGDYKGGCNKHLRLHRVVLGVYNDNAIIDHADGNGLNNQKNNLRVCKHMQNRHNSVGWGESKYPGVTKRGKKWMARIRPFGKYYHLGTYNTEQEAANAYAKKAQELYGEFSLTASRAI
jgi:hypothetical protein